MTATLIQEVRTIGHAQPGRTAERTEMGPRGATTH